MSAHPRIVHALLCSWGKLIENLADVGYTPSEFSLEPYDWRLPFPLLEERDGYFTKLRMSIEALHKTTGKKVVLTAHSMGTLVAH
jgi:phospholipid:diacylglycerol acyltransferase